VCTHLLPFVTDPRSWSPRLVRRGRLSGLDKPLGDADDDAEPGDRLERATSRDGRWSVAGNHAVAHFADAAHVTDEFVTGGEETLRRAPEPDAGRCTGEDDVAGQ
jgi:hypothetical protein